MPNQLFQNNQLVCEIIHYEITPGERRYIRGSQIGGPDFIVPGNQEPDRIVIRIPLAANFDISSYPHVVTIEGRRLSVAFENASFSSGYRILQGLILPQ